MGQGRVQDMAADQRPRERLHRLGVDALTAASRVIAAVELGRRAVRPDERPTILRSCDRGTMANRLSGATSPYLLQHADNPGRLAAVGR